MNAKERLLQQRSLFFDADVKTHLNSIAECLCVCCVHFNLLQMNINKFEQDRQINRRT